MSEKRTKSSSSSEKEKSPSTKSSTKQESSPESKTSSEKPSSSPSKSESENESGNRSGSETGSKTGSKTGRRSSKDDSTKAEEDEDEEEKEDKIKQMREAATARAKQMFKHLQDDPQAAAHNTIGTTVSCCAVLIGTSMMGVASAQGKQCKMDCIDVNSKGDDAVLGNLPKWYMYTGGIFICAGIMGCCTVGYFPIWLRECSPGCGGAIAALFTGLFGKICLLVLFGSVVLSNLLGTFWLFMANLCRDSKNSMEPGDPNYCHPLIWNNAYFVTYGFWVVSIIIFISVGAAIHKYFKGDGANYEVHNVEGGTQGPLKLPLKRGARGRMDAYTRKAQMMV